MAGTQTWEGAKGPWLSPFLDVLCQSSIKIVGHLAYIVYQIWLSRNSLVFEAKVIPTHQVLEKAIYMVGEYYHFNAASPSLEALGSWGSHATSVASQRVIFISWELPPPGFVKVNFDVNIRGAKGGAGYVIQDSDSKLLVAGGLCFFEPSILETKLRATWTDIICARQKLHTERIFIKEDSTTIVAWIQDETKLYQTHMFLYDIQSLLRGIAIVSILHIFWEANIMVNWVASYVVEHSRDWTWYQDAGLVWILQNFFVS